MENWLVSAVNVSPVTLYHVGVQLGAKVSVLDCFLEDHAQLSSLFPNERILCPPHRSAVVKTVRESNFEVALVHDGGNPVRTGLILQALRDAKVPIIAVMTGTLEYRPAYLAWGASLVLRNTQNEAALVRILRVYLARTKTRRYQSTSGIVNTWRFATGAAFQTRG